MFNLNKIIINILKGKEYELPKISIDLALWEKCFENVDEGILLYNKLKKENPYQYVFDNKFDLNNLGMLC